MDGRRRRRNQRGRDDSDEEGGLLSLVSRERRTCSNVAPAGGRGSHGYRSRSHVRADHTTANDVERSRARSRVRPRRQRRERQREEEPAQVARVPIALPAHVSRTPVLNLHYIIMRREDPPDICSICWGDFERGELLIPLHCNHTFHQQCIVRWMLESFTCPLCRSHIFPTLDTIDPNLYEEVEFVIQEDGTNE